MTKMKNYKNTKKKKNILMDQKTNETKWKEKKLNIFKNKKEKTIFIYLWFTREKSEKRVQIYPLTTYTHKHILMHNEQRDDKLIEK